MSPGKKGQISSGPNKYMCVTLIIKSIATNCNFFHKYDWRKVKKALVKSTCVFKNDVPLVVRFTASQDEAVGSEPTVWFCLDIMQKI